MIVLDTDVVAGVEGEGDDLGAGEVGLDVGDGGLAERGVGGDGDGLPVGAEGEGEVGSGGFADGDGEAPAGEALEGGGGGLDGVAARVEVGEEVEAGGGGLGGLGGVGGLAGEGDGGVGDRGSGGVGEAAAEGGGDLGLEGQGEEGAGEDGRGTTGTPDGPRERVGGEAWHRCPWVSVCCGSVRVLMWGGTPPLFARKYNECNGLRGTTSCKYLKALGLRLKIRNERT